MFTNTYQKSLSMSSETKSNKIRKTRVKLRERIDSLSKWGSDRLIRNNDIELLKEIEQILEDIDKGA